MIATHPANRPVSYYAPEVLKEEHRRSVAAQGVSGYELDRVLSLGPIQENPKNPQILLLAQDCLGALALPRTGIKTKANAIYAPYPTPHPGILPQYSYVLAALDRYKKLRRTQPPQRSKAGEIGGAASGETGPKGQRGAGI